MNYHKALHILLVVLGLFLSGSMIKCDNGPSEKSVVNLEPFQDWRSLEVVATAYNSLASQGSGDASITAWGDTLTPGVKSIAVSPDLISKGLTYNTPVKIIGLEGIFVVNDKMHPRWRNKIDIYMGVDRDKAITWGRKRVEICFPAPSAEKE